MNSNLGPYAAFAAAVVSVGVIAAAVVLHFLGRPGDPFIDDLAILAFGYVLGIPLAAQGLGAKAAADAANARLDKISAPPANGAS